MTDTTLNHPPIADRGIRHKAIRAALKVSFPGVKFSVTGSRGPSYARVLLVRVAEEYGIPEAERPTIVERLNYLGRPEWDIKDTEGRDAGTRPVYPGADGRQDWLTMVYRASQGSYPFDSEG